MLFLLVAAIFYLSTFAIHITVHISKPVESKKNETLHDRVMLKRRHSRVVISGFKP